MKTLTTLLFTFLMTCLGFAQEIYELPFFDDFEETISSNATFTKWTTENLEGWHYWHIIPGQHMRFENTDIIQNDWLITKQINCSGVENLKVNFSYLFHANKVPPKLYYTSQYNGDASQSTWKELSYSFGSNENQWYASEDFIIENPGEVIYFAFHYQADANAGAFFLLDNFKVIKYIHINYVQVGSSEHFEFYTNFVEESDFWLEIKDALEENYEKYWEAWMAPGWGSYLDDGVKIKTYYTEKENVFLITKETPNTQSGYFDRQSNSLYLTPLDCEEKTNYYTNLDGLAIHTFAGFAKQKELYRDNFPYENLQANFYEAFGLYEQGYRVRHDSILSNKANHPEKYKVQELNSMDIFKNTSDRDIMLSCIESQLIGGGYWNAPPDEGSEKLWNNYLTYFHDTTDVVRMKKYGESANFDIYCSSRDTMYMDSLKVWLERTRQFWVDSFQVKINNRFGLIILYDEKTAIDITGFGSFNGGSGGLNLSPHNYAGGISGYPWLLAHEFSHTFSYRLGGCPYGFYQEGLANFVGYKLYGVDWMEGKWKVNAVLDYYQQEYGRKPTLDEFAFNPHDKIDPYFFGLQFFHYLASFNSLVTIKEFFSKRLDFSVFGKPYEDIESGYIDYLKSFVASNLPEINTQDAEAINQTSAILNGAILSDGGTSITQRGFYWSSVNTLPNSDDHVEIVSGITGNFSRTLENLSPETIYYFRAFASNSMGTALGEVKHFKTLALPVLTELPFFDNFEELIRNDATFTYWTTENIEGWHYWHIIPGGGNGGQCMRFENTDIDQNDWLITKPINTSGVNRLNINFDNSHNRIGVKPELLYKILLKDGNVSDWIELEYSLGENSNKWYNSGNLVIEDVGDAIYFAFHYKASPENAIYFLMDNFNVTETITNISIKQNRQTNFTIYPNPTTSESVISFQTKTNDKVNLAVYDIQGRKICTLLDEKLNAVIFTIPLGNQIQTSGIYLCKLATSVGVSTRKLVVN